MAERLNLLGTASYILCPMCDLKKCVGTEQCQELKQYMKKLKQKYPDTDWVEEDA